MQTAGRGSFNRNWPGRGREWVQPTSGRGAPVETASRGHHRRGRHRLDEEPSQTASLETANTRPDQRPPPNEVRQHRFIWEILYPCLD